MRPINARELRRAFEQVDQISESLKCSANAIYEIKGFVSSLCQDGIDDRRSSRIGMWISFGIAVISLIVTILFGWRLDRVMMQEKLNTWLDQNFEASRLVNDQIEQTKQGMQEIQNELLKPDLSATMKKCLQGAREIGMQGQLKALEITREKLTERYLKVLDGKMTLEESIETAPMEGWRRPFMKMTFQTEGTFYIAECRKAEIHIP